MSSQKIIHISLSPLRAFHQTLMFSILGYQASYVTLIKLKVAIYIYHIRLET
jgi:hypothetical protein